VSVQRFRVQGLGDGRPEPRVDRSGCVAGELLVDDRTDDRSEGPVRVARPVADRPQARDEAGEYVVSGGDLGDRRA